MKPVFLTTFVHLFTITTFAFEPQLDWSQQWGSIEDDTTTGIAADGMGNIYVSGYTEGSIQGSNSGEKDAFLTKFDSTGSLLWNRQVGTSADDSAFDITADSLGNVYITGSTKGDFAGTLNGSSGSFVSKYNAAGTELWSHQFGDSFGAAGLEVTADGLGNIYVAGYGGISSGGVSRPNGRYAFLHKYDPSGNLAWDRKLDSSHNDSGMAVSIDPYGNVYLAGITQGDLAPSEGGSTPDVFISKYSSNGSLSWIRQWGTLDSETALSIAADGLGNVFFAGSKKGDGLIGLYSSNGVLQWTKTLRTAYTDKTTSVITDGSGNAFITGWTNGGRLGQYSYGGTDTFLAKYDSTGTQHWIEQLGTRSTDKGTGILIDPHNSIYLIGTTHESLAGPKLGREDGFIMKFIEIPEPSSVSISILFALILLISKPRNQLAPLV